MAIKPYNTPEVEAGDILYHYLSTEIFVLVEPEQEVVVDNEKMQLLHMSCEEIDVTALAGVGQTRFQAFWAVGNIYVDDLMPNGEHWHSIRNEDVARRLFPSLKTYTYGE